MSDFFISSRSRALQPSPGVARDRRPGPGKLKAASVLLVGAGGLGSPAALYLAASGVGTIGVIDNDRVDVSNLQRQVLYDTQSVGRPKARGRQGTFARAQSRNRAGVASRRAACRECARDLWQVRRGSRRHGPIQHALSSNDACVILRKPLVSAAIHRFEGQAMTYVPGQAPCYRCLFPEPPADGLVPNCAEAGVLGVLPGVMGTIQATEAIKVIVGVGEPLLGRLLTYDALAMRFGEFRFTRRSDCAVCGDHPTIHQPADLAEICSADVMAQVRRLSPHELRELLGKVAIVDVRSPNEFGASHLPGAVSIPVGDVSNGSPRFLAISWLFSSAAAVRVA